MEDVAAMPAAVEPIAGDTKSREKHLTTVSSSDSDEMYSDGSPKEILKSGGKAIAPTGEADIIYIPHVIDKTLILNRNNNDKNHDNLTPPSTVSLLDIGGGNSVTEIIYRKPFEDERELYLQTLYELPNSHNFYCPNCKNCITKVIILRDTPSSPSRSPRPLSDSKDGAYEALPSSTNIPTETRPRSPGLDVIGEVGVDDGEIHSSEEGGGRIICSNCFSFLLPIGAWISSQLGFGQKKPAIPTPTDIGGTAPTSHAGSPTIISREPVIEVEGGDSIAITIPPVSTEQASGRRGGRSLEIMKSIVYGGLTEVITSLGIVTSAASASTPTENIVALALANLITGLIVITNNLSGLKSNQLKKESNEGVDQAEVDPYEETLGDRHHYLLHFTTAILSFLVFGLLPPLVYGFSFRDTDDGDLKLAAVAVSSLLCIALLAIAKAYVQKANNWQEYAKTLVYYITLGFGASGLSYLAGKEFNMLLEQLGWFKKDPNAPTLLLPNMDLAKPTWGSI
ncbi:membrane protein of ER body 2-like [Benincasa hispida]|uniref:membrane protein of ER body 2-like n=1 Tax=Benincasa hispida TaxID=102211 RepID=UPI001901F986|nr:membrane protein of ER body 2-like [Benincasa hispida]